MPPRTNTLLPCSMAALAGLALWAAAALLTGKREPWDGQAYWLLAYPLALLVAGVLGYLFPERPWRWALTLFEVQFIAQCVRNGEPGNLWPLGMILFAVIALPAMLVARLAARAGARQHA